MSNLPDDPAATAARLAAIVESSNDAIISKDLNGVITSWNRAAEQLFGYTAEETIGRSVTMLMPEDRVNEEPGILERIRRGEAVDHYETIRRHKDGTLLDISLNISPIYDADGRVIGASKIVRDLTGRKREQAELAKLAAIVESSNDAIISKDINGIITSWNHGAEVIFGYTADETIGRPVTMLMPEDRVNEEPGILARIRRGERVDHYETVRRRKDGTLIDISLNISPVYDAHGNIVGASKIARDITEQNRVASVLREREIMQRLLDAQESERLRIARDLHDHLGQRMTALRLKIESLMEQFEDGRPLLKQAVDELRAEASRVDRDIGYLSWELRPTELEQLGLVNALRSFVREWSSQYGIYGEFHTNIDDSAAAPRLSKESETSLYRIVQEALNNVVKHAGASRVSVLLSHRKGNVGLIIEDDGNGFSRSGRPSAEGHLGLVGMRERTALLHGSLEIETGPGQGTTVLILVPVDDAFSRYAEQNEASLDPDPLHDSPF